MFKCDFCNTVFENVGGGKVHEKYCDENPNPQNRSNTRKYKRVDKQCPVCDSAFEARIGHPKEKTTCSQSCSNTYFNYGNTREAREKKSRSLKKYNKPNPPPNKNGYKKDYCKIYSYKECVVCNSIFVTAYKKQKETGFGKTRKTCSKKCESELVGNNKKNVKTCKKKGCIKELCWSNKYGFCKEHWMETEKFQKTIGRYSKRYDKGYIENWWTEKEVYLHSGLEKEFAEYLNEKNIKWRKPDPFSYKIDGKEHKYYPDFYLIDEGKFIELKGYFWKSDKRKMNAVINQNGDKHIEI